MFVDLYHCRHWERFGSGTYSIPARETQQGRRPGGLPLLDDI
jgi:hypothetical protein